jgi:hypothetical protein
MEKKYILDNDGYYLGIVDNELATHTKITELLPEFTDTQRCKWDGNQWLVEDSQTLIDRKTEYDAQEYARSRKPEYPDIGDQLDDLYHKGAFSDEMAVKIKAVKDAHPKPE